jgi:hypothetical protein
MPATRLPAQERRPTVVELEEVAVCGCNTGNDPELDTLMLECNRKTAARREGGLNLRFGDLAKRRAALTLAVQTRFIIVRTARSRTRSGRTRVASACTFASVPTG